MKTELKDELFATSSGKILQPHGIYFVKYLPKMPNNLHDDHYHIDFELTPYESQHYPILKQVYWCLKCNFNHINPA